MGKTIETQAQQELTPKERETHIFLLQKFYQLLKKKKLSEAEQVLKAAETVLINRGL